MTLRIALAILSFMLIASCETSNEVDDSDKNDLIERIRSSTTTEELTRNSVELAIMTSQEGCGEDNTRLIGNPDAVYSVVSSSPIAHRFTNSGTRLHSKVGPGGIGAESLILVAVEGETASDDTKETRSTFMFAESLTDPAYTDCEIQEAPFYPTMIDHRLGTLQFEMYVLPD